MTLQYASDLHLEFRENRELLLAHPLQPVADTLVLAGDILLFSELRAYKPFLRELGRRFPHVFWVPGNHEYYGSDIAERSGVLDEEVVPNVRLVNNIAVLHQGARLLFSTLWSPVSHMNEGAVRRNMSDYHVIRYGNGPLMPGHTTRLHEECRAFLEREFHQADNTSTVVITHHVPTLMHYPEQYKGDMLNEAFAVELHDLILAAQPAAWIYGHHHSNTPEFTIGRTRMLTNQLGYVKAGEHRAFDQAAVIRVQKDRPIL